jgi:hypothetical protein
VLQGLQALKAEVAEVAALVLDQVCSKEMRSTLFCANRAMYCIRLARNSSLAGCTNSLPAG